MGDRSNIFVQQRRKENGEWTGIGVYSHWGGTSLHNAALAALPKAKGRIGDPSYFARILIHNVLIEAADPDSETGAGLWTSETGMDDNEHPVLVINAETGEFWYANETGYTYDRKED